MKLSSNRLRQINILFLNLAMFSSPLQGSLEWGGRGSTTTTPDLLLPTNWENSLSVPTAGASGGNNAAFFDVNGSAQPTIASGNTLSLDKITFSNTSQSYEFTIQGTLELVGDGSLSLYSSGINNDSSSLQVFQVLEGGGIEFKNNSNAAFSASSDTSTISYSLGDLMDESSGSLSFNEQASAGGAQIYVYQESHLDFYDNSTASTSTIFISADPFAEQYPNVTFFDGATAASSNIESIGAEILFKDYSYAEESQITISGAPFVGAVTIPGGLQFSDFSSAGSATLNVVDGSIVTFGDSTSAEDATINLGLGLSTSTPVGNADFLGHSQAANAVINVQGGYIRNGKAFKSTLLFDHQSKANEATINLGDSTTGIGGKTMFFRLADAENATFNAIRNSVITFYDHSTASDAIFNLNDTSALIFKGVSTSSNATINLDDFTTTLEFNQLADDYFTGVVAGFGTMSKTGTGTLHFQGDASSFFGGTDITKGVLAIDSLLSSDVTINGGALGGSGRVKGLVIAQSGGALFPDKSTLTIEGHLIQEAGSAYYVNFDETGQQHSKIEVVGKVTLENGASILIKETDGSLQLPPNQTLTAQVISTTDGIQGKYGTLYSENPLVVGTLLEDGQNVFVTFSNKLAGIPYTGDQLAVSTQLQALNSLTATQAEFLYQLAALPQDAGALVLEQLSAEQYSNLIVAAEMSNEQYIQRLFNPLRSIVTSSGCGIPQKGLVWLDVAYQRGFLHGQQEAKGFKSKGYEITIGAQTPLPNNWTFGTALCYEHNNFDFNLNGSSINYGLIGAFYAVYRPADYYVLTDLIYGYNRHKLQRHVALSDSRYYIDGEPEVFQGTLYVEAGKDFRYFGLLFQPFLGLEGGYYRRNRINEYCHSNFFAPVVIHTSSRGMGHTRLGAHITTDNWCNCVVSLDLAWRYRFTSLNNDMHAHFRDFGEDYLIEGVKLKRNSLDGALDITTTIGQSWSLYIEAAGQWWEKAGTYSLLTGATYSW